MVGLLLISLGLLTVSMVGFRDDEDEDDGTEVPPPVRRGFMAGVRGAGRYLTSELSRQLDRALDSEESFSRAVERDFMVRRGFRRRHLMIWVRREK
jgi:hypothetical protein